MSGSDHERMLEAIRNYKWTPEDRERWKKYFEDYSEYMNQLDHPGDCYCCRCMYEFLSKDKK
jgi:glutamyl/glutaminyl-tRNA synthetase